MLVTKREFLVVPTAAALLVIVVNLVNGLISFLFGWVEEISFKDVYYSFLVAPVAVFLIILFAITVAFLFQKWEK